MALKTPLSGDNGVPIPFHNLSDPHPVALVLDFCGRVAVRCSALQGAAGVAVCCSVLLCVTV